MEAEAQKSTVSLTFITHFGAMWQILAQFTGRVPKSFCGHLVKCSTVFITSYNTIVTSKSKAMAADYMSRLAPELDALKGNKKVFFRSKILVKILLVNVLLDVRIPPEGS